MDVRIDVDNVQMRITSTTIADRVSVTVADDKSVSQIRRSLRTVTQSPTSWYRNQRTRPNCNHARDYLRQRKRYRLGTVPISFRLHVVRGNTSKDVALQQSQRLLRELMAIQEVLRHHRRYVLDKTRGR